ncbi:MAG: DUF3368 domain-containing protein [Pyrinomonadaceae bacterium]
MIVVADTTPINYLILIQRAEVLHELYGRVVIPQAVFDELQHAHAPATVKEWIVNRPSWIEVQQVVVMPDAALERLDEGEREAIVLAGQLSADAILIDERDGVREALRRNLRVTGTLGVLDEAAARGLIDLMETIELLQQTSFRASQGLLNALLKSDADRKRNA